MKKFAALALAGLALTGLTARASAEPVDRDAAVWDAAMNRMNTQLDAWFEDGEFPKIIQMLRVHQELYPSDYEIATSLGWMYGNVSQPDAELATYLRYRKDNPTSPDAYLPEAQFYFLKRSYAKVINILEPINKEKSHPNVWRMLANSYERAGMFKDSERIWAKYVELHPRDERAKANLERVRKKLDEAKKP